MKGGHLSKETLHVLRSYCIFWRRRDGLDRFRHWVLAESMSDATTRSRAEISKALGSNAGLWDIEGTRTNVVGSGLVSDRARRGDAHRSVGRVWLLSCSLIVLVLVLFLFRLWTLSAVP
jgi:hypothetical protein